MENCVFKNATFHILNRCQTFEKKNENRIQKEDTMNVNLILGLVWLVWFFVGVLGKEEPNWTDYGWIVISDNVFSWTITSTNDRTNI